MGLVAEDQGERLGQGGLVEGGAGVRVGADQPQAPPAQGGAQLRPRRPGRHRQVEQAAGGGPHRLGALEVDRPAGGDDGVGPEGVGRAQHGAGVARVADLGQHAHQARGRRQRLQGPEHARQHRDQALRGGGVGQGGQHRLGHQRHPGAALAGQVDQAGVAGRGPLGGQQAVGDVAGLEGRPDPLRPLQQEAAIGPGPRRRPGELARRPHRGVAGAGDHVHGAAGAARQALPLEPLEPLESFRPWRALVTRLANVRGSVTAMSARTLRSTWMPARRSPEMNRL